MSQEAKNNEGQEAKNNEAQVTLSEDEAKLYDRQLRLWGVTSQNRIRNSRVLCIGVGGLGAEVAKNIVLTGIGHLTLCDEREVTIDHLGSNFFLRDAHIGQNLAESSSGGVRLLNPNVEVTSDTRSVASLTADFVQSFDVVLVTDQGVDVQIRANELCRSESKQTKTPAFFGAEVLGWIAYHVADLKEHKYVVKKKQTGDEEAVEESHSTKAWCSTPLPKCTKKSCEYPSISELYGTDLAGVQQCFGRRLKAPTATYCCVRILQRFRQIHSRFPSSDDIEQIKEIRKEMTVGLNADLLLPMSTLESIVDSGDSYFSPVCAVFGGLLASEVLKIISGKDRPWENCMVYSAHTNEAVCRSVFPSSK